MLWRCVYVCEKYYRVLHGLGVNSHRSMKKMKNVSSLTCTYIYLGLLNQKKRHLRTTCTKIFRYFHTRVSVKGFKVISPPPL